MKVRYTAQAVLDLEVLARYARDNLSESAVRVLGVAIQEAALRLQEFPALGSQGRVPGTHELVLTRINIVVTYQVERDTVAILSVLRAEKDRP